MEDPGYEASSAMDMHHLLVIEVADADTTHVFRKHIIRLVLITDLVYHYSVMPLLSCASIVYGITEKMVSSFVCLSYLLHSTGSLVLLA